jgi:hypothetical protein
MMVDTAKIFANIAAAKRGFRAAKRAGFDLDRDGCTLCGLSVYPSAREAFRSAAAPATTLTPRIHAPALIRRVAWWADVTLWHDDPTPYESRAAGMLLNGDLLFEATRPAEVAALHAVRGRAELATQVRAVDVVEALERDALVGSLRVRDLWREVAAEVRRKSNVLDAAIARFDALREQDEALRRMKSFEIGLRVAGLDISTFGTPFLL